MSLTLQLERFKWTGTNPTFTLIARTVGGPPDIRWERDGEIIKSTDYSFSFSFDLDVTEEDYQRLVPYDIRLIAHGVLPGNYTFIVSNRLTDRFFKESIFIEGN